MITNFQYQIKFSLNTNKRENLYKHKKNPVLSQSPDLTFHI